MPRGWRRARGGMGSHQALQGRQGAPADTALSAPRPSSQASCQLPGELLTGTRLGASHWAHGLVSPLPGLQDATRVASSPPRLGDVGSCLRAQSLSPCWALGSGGGVFPLPRPLGLPLMTHLPVCPGPPSPVSPTLFSPVALPEKGPWVTLS